MEQRRKDTNYFPFLQTFLGLFSIIWILSTPSNRPERHMSHGFMESNYITMIQFIVMM